MEILDILRTFIGSGHVDTIKILESEGYIIPLHEFIRALIYEDREFYYPQESQIVNLFDISSNDPKEHFLKSTILCFLNKAPKKDSSGYVEVKNIYDNIQSLCFTPQQIDH